MWRRKKFLNWNQIHLSQTPGSAHQASRSLNQGTQVSDVQKVNEPGNVLSATESQGFREKGPRPQSS